MSIFLPGVRGLGADAAGGGGGAGGAGGLPIGRRAAEEAVGVGVEEGARGV